MRICSFEACDVDLDAAGYKVTARYCCDAHKVAAYRARRASRGPDPTARVLAALKTASGARNGHRNVTRCPRCGWPL